MFSIRKSVTAAGQGTTAGTRTVRGGAATAACAAALFAVAGCTRQAAPTIPPGPPIVQDEAMQHRQWDQVAASWSDSAVQVRALRWPYGYEEAGRNNKFASLFVDPAAFVYQSIRLPFTYIFKPWGTREISTGTDYAPTYTANPPLPPVGGTPPGLGPGIGLGGDAAAGGATGAGTGGAGTGGAGTGGAGASGTDGGTSGGAQNGTGADGTSGNGTATPDGGTNTGGNGTNNGTGTGNGTAAPGNSASPNGTGAGSTNNPGGASDRVPSVDTGSGLTPPAGNNTGGTGTGGGTTPGGTGGSTDGSR